jgi:hypothetical protein
MSRPEYVKCALTGRWNREEGQQEPKPEQKTWCGKDARPLGFTFVDAAHALLNQGRLMLCKRCAAAMRKRLDEISDY